MPGAPKIYLKNQQNEVRFKVKKARKKLYQHRVVIVFSAVCIMFAVLLLRIAVIQNSSAASAAAEQSERKISVGTTRGAIYDRNYRLLVNTEKENNVAVLSCKKTENTLAALGLGTDEAAVEGLVIIKKHDNTEKDSALVKNIETYKRYSENQLCTHIIGYVDFESRGVCGIEKAFDAILSDAAGEAWIKYSVDARGRTITGDGIEVGYDNYFSKAGVVLTLDRDIQEIVQQAIKNSEIVCGGAVVLSAKTGEILAMASYPEYDVRDISASLYDENLPFLNRCLCAYPVGSVFKPFVVAAALKNGVDITGEYNCKGYYTAGEQIFRCFNGKEHGAELLRDAICNSCNAYFIDLGVRIGKEKLEELCNDFGFGKSIELCPYLCSDAGNLPHSDSIISEAQLANLCFGQGELLLTPLQLAAAYSALANGGEYTEPYILKELADKTGRAYAYYKPENSRRVLDEKSCDKINECLFANMLEGTGVNGAPGNSSACGKTATAQTGKYSADGTEQLCTWFAGFFPYESPEYTVVVFNEKGSTASQDCAPVFSDISQKITALRDAQKESSLRAE